MPAEHISVVVDEEGRLLNYVPIAGRSMREKYRKIIRPYAYYCFACDNILREEERMHIDCDICGEHRFIRVVVANGDVMWIK